MLEYRQLFRNHIKGFEFYLTIAIISITLWIYLRIETNISALNLYIGIFNLISLLPVAYLYIEYLSINKRSAVFNIDCARKEIIYFENNSSNIIPFNEIDKIIVNVTPSWTRGDKVQMMPFEQFHYAHIYTKAGFELIITSLLIDNVESAVRNIIDVPVEQKTRFFPSVILE